jgi:hypothetical protein
MKLGESWVMILPFPPSYNPKVVVFRYLLTSQGEWPAVKFAT